MIAALGPEHSYTHIAAQAAFDGNIILTRSIKAAFEKVLKGEAEAALVPVENMLHGSVRETLLGLLQEVGIAAAYTMPIHHCIAAQGKYDKIASKQEALNQCEKKLAEIGKPTISTSSTSEAFKLATNDPSIAAIGAKKAAEHYGLTILAENIEDNPSNKTTFIEIRKQGGTQGNRTSLAIMPHEDRPGLLFEILSVFKIKNINLTKIESIPTGNKLGEYNFFVEIDGNAKHKNVQDALRFLETIVRVKNLGSYKMTQL